MIIDQYNYKNYSVGAKAQNLFRMMETGYKVPPFFCVNSSFRESETADYLHRHFPDTDLFSVRSSASVEDGNTYSFAGQFQTFLRVQKKDVCDRIRDVLSSAERDSAGHYLQAHHMERKPVSMHVMIQEMIEAERSGVLFTANPQQRILNETVIVLGAGSGEQIVEDRTDTTIYYFNRSDRLCYYEQANGSPLLSRAELEELILLSGQIQKEFAMECDIEFALKAQKLWFLQVRPITALKTDEPVIILDNSNIVESYPGITLPLTQSFIQEAYYQVFKNLLLRLTREPETVRQIDDMLKHMVDMANGRVYYRISNWYDILLFLPFCKKLIPVWQEMMGVADQTVSSCFQGNISRRTRRKVAVSFFRLLLTCPRKMEQLDGYYAEITKHFASLDMDTGDNRILLNHYHSLQDMTVKRWDITLVNDMYAFLFTGLLKAYLKMRRVPDYELLAKRAVSGIRELESLEPIQELKRLAGQACTEERINELKQIRTNADYDRYIKENRTVYAKKLEDYIQRFGDRNVEELKLESRTFRTDPILLIKRILQYAQEDSDRNPGRTDTAFIADQEHTREVNMQNPCVLPDKIAVFLAGKASLGIRNREKSRLNRSRLYGMMRTLALRMGKNLYTQGRIEQPEDIFWLGCHEIRQASLNAALDLHTIIAERKENYRGFYRLPAWSRLMFAGKVMDRHPNTVRNVNFQKEHGIFQGTACSQGTAEGEVLLIHQPSLTLNTKDRILVTRMTDPGWVFLLADARAVISEKGSLLSHTAIISRELGKPAVTGIPHIMEYLEDGDRVRVDGDSGTVTLLQRHAETGGAL